MFSWFQFTQKRSKRTSIFIWNGKFNQDIDIFLPKSVCDFVSMTVFSPGIRIMVLNRTISTFNYNIELSQSRPSIANLQLLLSYHFFLFFAFCWWTSKFKLLSLFWCIGDHGSWWLLDFIPFFHLGFFSFFFLSYFSLDPKKIIYLKEKSYLEKWPKILSIYIKRSK